MKFILLLISLLLLSTVVYAKDSIHDANTHIVIQPDRAVVQHKDCKSDIELSPKSISAYQRMGCLFSNKYYSVGSILNLDGTKSQCVTGTPFYHWKILK